MSTYSLTWKQTRQLLSEEQLTSIITNKSKSKSVNKDLPFPECRWELHTAVRVDRLSGPDRSLPVDDLVADEIRRTSCHICCRFGRGYTTLALKTIPKLVIDFVRKNVIKEKE